MLEIAVPDLGDFDEVEVVEVHVSKGDSVAFDDLLVSIESDKATMEIPSTAAGVVAELRVSEGDRVSEGSVLVVVELAAEVISVTDPAELAPAINVSADHESRAMASGKPGASELPETRSVQADRELSPAAANPVPDRTGVPHASPLIRRYARELGVPIEESTGSGVHGRILVDDLKQQVRERFSEGTNKASGQSGPGIPAMPDVDHGAHGPVREEKLTRIQRVSGPVLHRSWLNVPHVTQYDVADVTDLEIFRRKSGEAASQRGLKLSPLLFVMKAVAIALAEYPTFRASLAREGDRLWIKEYFHLGIAVDTDQGLVVPVIRDVDRKGIFELAEELNATAKRARDRKLSPEDLRGACFTISSLGGIGGTAFSPIVNAPEVAILGLSKTRVAPVWDGPSPVEFASQTDLVKQPEASDTGSSTFGQFHPRLMLPFSLSYDHRVIDGAEAARFTSRLARLIADPAQLLL